MTQTLNLYLVSDSSGETVISVSSAVVSQFADLKVEKFMWPMVRSFNQIDKLTDDIRQKPGVVLFTVADDKLRQYMKEKCTQAGAKCIPAITHVIEEFVEHLGMKASIHVSGAKHSELSEKYFSRIEAINFAINHDDGQSLHDLNEADIVLVGVSRSSKSPTTFYLAQRGLKVANVPYIKGVGLGINPKEVVKPLVIGLVISPERLKQIRSTRLMYLKSDTFAKDYTDDHSIREEIREIRQLIAENNWPYIDVTGKAIEETSAEIINMYFEKVGARQTFGW
jgi:regulator of PEP synthase PpsR (kinase-PPPase family)